MRSVLPATLQTSAEHCITSTKRLSGRARTCDTPVKQRVTIFQRLERLQLRDPASSHRLASNQYLKIFNLARRPTTPQWDVVGRRHPRRHRNAIQLSSRFGIKDSNLESWASETPALPVAPIPNEKCLQPSVRSLGVEPKVPRRTTRLQRAWYTGTINPKRKARSVSCRASIWC